MIEIAKRTLRKIIKGQKGQALPVVLILLVIGGLPIALCLGYASTSLKVGQMHEERMAELYAADAGIEDAVWKIKNHQIPTDPYHITINNKDVEVLISTTTAIEFIADLLGENIHEGPHADWMIVYESPQPGVFNIRITYSGSAQNKKIDGLGAWLRGTYTYKEGSAHGITDDYPQYSFEDKPYGGGTVFIWEWEAAQRPVFSQGQTRIQTFEFEPEQTPPTSLAWVIAGSNDIWISGPGGELMFAEITATATSDTGKWSEVVAHSAREGTGVPYTMSILTWEINPPA